LVLLIPGLARPEGELATTVHANPTDPGIVFDKDEGREIDEAKN
jgi:hypothetical protein